MFGDSSKNMDGKSVRLWKITTDKINIGFHHCGDERNIPDQHLYHICNETLIAYGHRTARLPGPVNPNDWSDDPQYIINLVKRIVTVSLETMKIVNGLPELGV